MQTVAYPLDNPLAGETHPTDGSCADCHETLTWENTGVYWPVSQVWVCRKCDAVRLETVEG